MAGGGVSGLGGVNIDPHLDVREEVGSGMPFRRLIERGVLEGSRYTTLGAGRFSNSGEHVRWLRARGGRVVTLEAARGVVPGQAGADLWGARVEESLRRGRLLGDGCEPGFVSFDLDALDGSVGPGVSAVNAHGLTAAEAVAAAELVGEAPGGVHFDVMELCPEFDVDARTARLAAQLAARFIAGACAR